jgi:antitoxin PrlF
MVRKIPYISRSMKEGSMSVALRERPIAAEPIVVNAKITSKGQTTVPQPVRRALGVGGGDRIAYRIDGHDVTLQRAEDGSPDPVIGKFLAFLAKDMEANPERLKHLTPELARRLNELVGDIDIDIDEPIEGDVGL